MGSSCPPTPFGRAEKTFWYVGVSKKKNLCALVVILNFICRSD